MKIRFAAPDETEALAAISAQEPDSWTAEGFAGTLKTETARVWVAEESGVICAYAVIYFDSDGAELVQIAVGRNARRRGIASQLLAAVLLFLEEQSVPQIVLEVRAGNKPARAFYLKHGFAEIFIQRNFYRDPPDDAVRMIKVITEK